jgi:uncharacterized protein (TIGR00369 family)
VLHIDERELLMRMQIQPQFLAPNGFLHAASVIALADTACGFAVIAHLPPGAESFTTIELKSNFLGTAREGAVDAVARGVHLGRNTQVWDATVTEVAVAPVLRWSGFPWNHVLQTDLRLGPLGLSYTPYVSPLERGSDGRGSQFLNFLMIETAFSQPGNKHDELFLRLHHRCTIYDLLNDYGANGEDFFGIGYRRYF